MKKPTPEAKALSLYLMAFKKTNPKLKDQSKRINRQWDLVGAGELNKADYDKEVLKLLNSHGGYTEVVENTVAFYLETTGVWKLVGDDKYCADAQKVAERILIQK